MSIRIVASGDQHIGSRFTSALDQERVLAALIDAALEADVLFLLGDATHRPRPDPAVLALWGRQLRRLEGRGIPVVAIAGNETHDGPDVVEVLGQFRGELHVVTEPKVVRLRRHPDAGGSIDVACLPWLPDAYVRAAAAGERSRIETSHALTRAATDIVAGFAAQKHLDIPMVLLTHATIAGAVTSTGYDMGFIPQESYVIPVEALEPFDFVFAGHIHRHQKIAENAAYSGSLLPVSFAETEPKGFIAATIDHGADARYGRGFHESVVHGGCVKWEHVPVPAPRVVTVELDHRHKIERHARYIQAEQGDLEDALVRVRVKCDEATAREFPPAVLEAAFRDGAGARVVQVELDIQREDRRRDASLTSELSPANALERYLDGSDIADDARPRILEHGTAVALELEQVEHATAGDIDLVRIEARDFIGVSSADVEFDGHGTYALTGPVGSGKSTIGSDAVRFTLFGASRAGAKPSERLIRNGADAAFAAVELRAPHGRYRVVRKLRRTARGVQSSLDVLQWDGDDPHGIIEELHPGSSWQPLSSGKVADGDAAIARLLGGLTDETLCASTFVLQGDSGRVTRTAPEDRRRLLADAGGLGIYDRLADVSREHLRDAQRALDVLHAQADQLRGRAGVVDLLEQELAAADETRAQALTAVDGAEREQLTATDALDRARERATAYTQVLEDAKRLQSELDRVDGEIAEWENRKRVANEMLAARPELERARADLATVQQELVELMARQAAESAESLRRARLVGDRANLQIELSSAQQKREREARVLDERITSMRAQESRLAAAECCRPEPSCVFLDDARADVARIPALEQQLAAASELTDAEKRLADRIVALVIPPAPDLATTEAAIADARERARRLEANVQVAEKIAKAEQVLEEYVTAAARLEERRAGIAREKATKNGHLIQFGADPRAAADRAAASLAEILRTIQRARTELDTATSRVGFITGRLEEARSAAAELALLEQKITAAAVDVAAWNELVTAWRSCRVMVLEISVIPAVEATANEILRRFPYGLQIALATQRDRRSGDGVTETLDIEVLGGKGAVYEMCSGGQKSVIDFALHTAIALVVSRRSGSRLKWMDVDEPAFLDEAGYSAFADVVRWIHQELGITVVVSSHVQELVDAIEGPHIVVVPGPDGSTVRMAA